VKYLATLLGQADEVVLRWFILVVALLLDQVAVLLLPAATRRKANAVAMEAQRNPVRRSWMSETARPASFSPQGRARQRGRQGPASRDGGRTD